MAKNIIDARQSEVRAHLERLGQAATRLGSPAQPLDEVIFSTDTELNYPLRPYASFPAANARLNFSDSLISAADDANKVMSPVSGVIYDGITGAFINFQTQALSNAADFDITFPVTNTVGRFRRAAFMLNSSGKIQVVFSDEELTEGALPNAGTLFTSGTPIGYIDLECTNVLGYFKTAGSATNIIENSKIYRFGNGAGGGAASAEAGAAQEEPIPVDVTEITVTFPTPLSGTSYVVEAQIVNLVDASPDYFDVTITDKTINGFTAKWNAPTDSANYRISYIVPRVQEQNGESEVPLDATSITINLPIALFSTNYAVVAGWVNITDASPQFQPITITDKTDTTFTAEWNANTDSANYRISYRVAEYQ